MVRVLVSPPAIPAHTTLGTQRASSPQTATRSPSTQTPPMTSRTQRTCRALGRALILTRCWEMWMSRQTMVSSEDCMRPMDAAR
jgi:hypothetical protein